MREQKPAGGGHEDGGDHADGRGENLDARDVEVGVIGGQHRQGAGDVAPVGRGAERRFVGWVQRLHRHRPRFAGVHRRQRPLQVGAQGAARRRGLSNRQGFFDADARIDQQTQLVKGNMVIF